jgi:hypothetical protein
MKTPQCKKPGWTFNAVVATKDGLKIFQKILGKLR